MAGLWRTVSRNLALRLSNGSSVIADRPYFASSVMILGSGTVSYRVARACVLELDASFAVTAICLLGVRRRFPRRSLGTPASWRTPRAYWPRDRTAPTMSHHRGSMSMATLGGDARRKALLLMLGLRKPHTYLYSPRRLLDAVAALRQATFDEAESLCVLASRARNLS